MTTNRQPARRRRSSRLNSCLLIDNTAKAHLPGPQNPGECRLYLAEGCHLYIALTRVWREWGILETSRRCRVGQGRRSTVAPEKRRITEPLFLSFGHANLHTLERS